ncbi:DUF4244 domain-containing protein [Streptomyces sp. SID8379]|uniref:DUF4244 domain-containing protein n=1 Tax=unclassified Streptomyces TaxID=2593676 RepID=UPI000997FD92|nr:MULTISPECIES: DUF4244 domain-containing protein [unclassified Streptomyces]MYW70343.1 DUF4244 domain-containing protein [Streptomyces sp. SID8379]
MNGTRRATTYGRLRGRILRWARGVRSARKDAGMVTSEYAVGLIAAVGFAGVLYQVVTSDLVQSALQSLVAKALHGSF